MPTQSLTSSMRRAVCVRLAGRVQGLGVRPALARLAARLDLAGSVVNTADGVTLALEGAADAIEQFLDALAAELPEGAAVERLEVEAAAVTQRASFAIFARAELGAGSAAVPLDRVVCTACRAEIEAPSARRHHYPFTSCTNCGPRYSIIETMPYDRSATTMHPFPMCPACGQEYRAAVDRRFHAQTNACPQCGPQISLVDEAGRTTFGPAALAAAAAALRAGRCVALKGLGGYQLLVDATSADAVRRLRLRKQRRTKPLAVLVGSLAEAERLAILNTEERRWLTDPGGPIVVVRRRGDAALATDVGPGMNSVGLLLPTTPLHALLCEAVRRPLVCTSANREAEPLVYDPTSAERELQGIADLWLHHDRQITRPIDDSVMRVIAGEPCFLRLARGYAPHRLPLPSASGKTQFLACGGEQKAAIALCNGSQAVLGPHVGDLTAAATCERWVEQLHSLAALYDVALDAAEIAHDLHPDYFSSTWARAAGGRHAVQHHHAHLAAVMLEHELWDREVLGLAWDGTGFGADGGIWGGECLRADCRDYQRIAWLRPFPLWGGERAVREPWRIAAALVGEALGFEAAARLAWPTVAANQRDGLLTLAAKSRRSWLLTSSMGRLFDGVAALVLGAAHADDEGRPAMLLEQACDLQTEGAYPLPYHRATGEIDWRPLVVAVMEDLHRGASPGAAAMRFHRAVAGLAHALAQAHPQLPLATSGGVFQNGVLGELLAERLAGRAAGWLRPRAIPPGDGGLAAGQLAIAMARFTFAKKG